MKLTSMKSFVFLSGLKHTHRSDVRGPSLKNHFLVNKVALMMGTGEMTQLRVSASSSLNSFVATAEEWFCVMNWHIIELTLKTAHMQTQ